MVENRKVTGKTSISLPSDIDHVFLRHDCDSCVGRRSRHRQSWSSVRRQRAAGSPFLPDPADGAHGPERGNVEAARLSRLGAQTSEFFYANSEFEKPMTTKNCIESCGGLPLALATTSDADYFWSEMRAVKRFVMTGDK